jgi:hypothetical protein
LSQGLGAFLRARPSPNAVIRPTYPPITNWSKCPGPAD